MKILGMRVLLYKYLTSVNLGEILVSNFKSLPAQVFNKHRKQVR